MPIVTNKDSGIRHQVDHDATKDTEIPSSYRRGMLTRCGIWLSSRWVREPERGDRWCQRCLMARKAEEDQNRQQGLIVGRS